MKDALKNPILDYILIPSLVALWPLLVWAVYLPDVEDSGKNLKEQYTDTQIAIQKILHLAPERLEFTDSANGKTQFAYATAVEKVASMCKISPESYKLSSGVIITTREQKTQSARVGLKEVNITKFADFLSTLLLHWPTLKCTSIKLTRDKNEPDNWDVDLDFKYYF